MGKETAPKGPDNNKHLAHLEAGFSALAIALVANGVAIAEGADPFELAIAQLKSKAALQAESDKLATFLLEHHAGAIEGSAVDTVIKLLETAKGDNPEQASMMEQRALDAEKRIVTLTSEVGELEQDLADMTNEKNRLANELAAAYEGRPFVNETAEQAPAPAAPIVRERPETAADVGPDYHVLELQELGELFASGEAHGLELAFSNGEHEIVSLERIAIASSDIVRLEGRYTVHRTVYAKLAATDAGEELDGVGLLLGGEQIAYGSFPEKLRLEPGNERRFERAIAF